MLVRSLLCAIFVSVLGIAGCEEAAPPKPPRTPEAKAGPCFEIHGDGELRASDAQKMVQQLVDGIQLAPEDEALRHPKSTDDIKKILKRDSVYLFSDAAAYARSLDTTEGRSAEATLELLLGESQLLASQVLSSQEAWVGTDLRIARAYVAGRSGESATERGHMLEQLVVVVEEGNKIADALGLVAPKHLARGAEVIRRLEKDAPNERHTLELGADYHRLRGEWPEFEKALAAAEVVDKASPALCYMRGMEQLERYRKTDQAIAAMRDCLSKYPSFVRAQAAIVLMSSNPMDALREVHALKKMNPDHYLVMLLEPTLAAVGELHRMQGTADATR